MAIPLCQANCTVGYPAEADPALVGAFVELNQKREILSVPLLGPRVDPLRGDAPANAGRGVSTARRVERGRAKTHVGDAPGCHER